jgi:hypothetical protein
MKITDEMIDAGGRALYEMSKGQDWPGYVHGLKCRHVGTRAVSEAVLRAALAAPRDSQVGREETT